MDLLLDTAAARFVRAAAEGEFSFADLPRLAAVDPRSLGEADRVELVRAWERARAMADGAQQHALAAVWEATRACGLEGEAARHEVGAALRLSAGTAADRVGIADILTRRLPDTQAALCAGDIGYLHAKHLAQAVCPLSDEVTATVEAGVLAEAGGQSLAEFRKAVQAAVLAADPAGAAERAQQAQARRAITRHRQPEAIEGWWITMSAHLGGLAWARLTERARTIQAAIRNHAGIDPGIDALRVDALLDAILADHDDTAADDADATSAAGTDDPTTTRGTSAAETAATSGTTHAPPPVPPPVPRCRCGGAQTAAVVIDLPTLLGLAHNPGEIPGYGPVPATVARELAADRDWERWTTHPHTRALLDRSPLTYRPGRRLRGFIVAAHRTCSFPGCHHPAENTDLDHRATFTRGGRTIVINLGPLCRTHHNAKTHGRWRITYHPDLDHWTWTSPLGKTYPAQHHPPLRI